MNAIDSPGFNFSLCDEHNPLWEPFAECLNEIAPEQAPFVLGDYSRNLPCTLILALRDTRVAGFLRFGMQEIGPEFGCRPLVVDGVALTEAKIHAFAVRPECRRQGVGMALQAQAIGLARTLGCHQLTSHTSRDNVANLALKLRMGFAAQPEGSDGGVSVLLYMPLQVV